MIENTINKTYLKSYTKVKEKPVKHNLDFNKILSNKHFFESEKGIISERLTTNSKKLFEIFGKYFFKNKKEKGSNYYKKLDNIKSNKNNKNVNNGKNKNNEHTRLINKLIKHRFMKNKTNNNTPHKTRFIHSSTNKNIKVTSGCLSPVDYQMRKATKFL